MTGCKRRRLLSAVVLAVVGLASWAAKLEAGQCPAATITGYTIRGTTATGVPAGPGIAAVDPAVIPLGSRVYVEGLGSYLAADTGGGVRGCWVDVWVSTTAEAYAISGTRAVSW